MIENYAATAAAEGMEIFVAKGHFIPAYQVFSRLRFKLGNTHSGYYIFYCILMVQTCKKVMIKMAEKSNQSDDPEYHELLMTKRSLLMNAQCDFVS